MSWPLQLAESGRVPEPLLRAGIRHLLRRRLSGLTNGSGERRQRLVETLGSGPIAVATDTANEQHYELPPEFFKLVLGRHLKYSGCHWPQGVAELGAAEAAMLSLTCQRAGIADGMTVLDLGCGWGSLSLWIAERYPRCRVQAVSNSGPQRLHIESEARHRGLTNIAVETADMNDYRPDRRFDRVVSIEMFEHMRNYRELLARIAGWLEPDGRLFVHVFCHHAEPYLFEVQGSDDWMARHFFTGGLMPSADLFDEFTDDLVVEQRWLVDGTHYERTARAWLERMERRRDAVLEVFAPVYGDAGRELWFQRWRLFFLACAELFGYRGGREWLVGHYRLRPATGGDPQ